MYVCFVPINRIAEPIQGHTVHIHVYAAIQSCRRHKGRCFQTEHWCYPVCQAALARAMLQGHVEFRGGLLKSENDHGVYLLNIFIYTARTRKNQEKGIWQLPINIRVLARSFDQRFWYSQRRKHICNIKWILVLIFFNFGSEAHTLTKTSKWSPQ